MPSLKDLKNRIQSVKNTQKITRAMQMVAAAKLRKAQDRAESARPYTQHLAKVIAGLAHSMGDRADAPPLLVGTRRAQTVLLLVATADRGLCGGFNSNIVRYAREHIVQLQKEGKVVKLFLVGKKGYEQLSRQYKDLILTYVSLKEERQLHMDIVENIGAEITQRFAEGEFDICQFIFSEFKNVMTQTPAIQTLIPASADMETVAESSGRAVYAYEPHEAAILDVLLPRNINTRLFTALLENQAGEMGAKMAAMDNATRNAGEMIDKLTLTFNRTRQAQITSELIEVISGAEAL